MTADRGRILYVVAGAVVAAGATWWFLAAPPEQGDGDLAQWRESVEQQLPDDGDQEDAGTLTLRPEAEHDVETPVGTTGKYLVSVICRGGPGTTVRVSLSPDGNDSGLGMSCSDYRPPDRFEVGLADMMRLHVVVGDQGPVVFRYSLRRVDG